MSSAREAVQKIKRAVNMSQRAIVISSKGVTRWFAVTDFAAIGIFRKRLRGSTAGRDLLLN
jgi:hypothetical protein